MMDEQAIVLRARQGDEEAFALLVEAYRGKVYRLALRMCGGNEADADEAAQEAFIAAWRGLPRFRGEAQFSTWLYRLTSNAAVDLLRREKRRGAAVPLEEAIDAADPGQTPQQAAEEKETSQQVREALMELPEEYREIILLRHMQDLSYEEIGLALSLPAGTVKSRLNRAKARLKEILLQQGNFFGAESVLPTETNGKEERSHV